MVYFAVLWSLMSFVHYIFKCLEERSHTHGFQNNVPVRPVAMSASQNDMLVGRTVGRRVTFMHAFSVKKARGINIKGKNGTNDVFVTIGLGKEKYQTSVKEKATENVEWCEQCEL